MPSTNLARTPPTFVRLVNFIFPCKWNESERNHDSTKPDQCGIYTDPIELPKIDQILKGTSGLWSSAEALHIEKSQKPPCLIEDPWGRRFWIFSSRIFLNFLTKFFNIKSLLRDHTGRKRFPGKVSKSFEKRPVRSAFSTNASEKSAVLSNASSASIFVNILVNSVGVCFFVAAEVTSYPPQSNYGELFLFHVILTAPPGNGEHFLMLSRKISSF